MLEIDREMQRNHPVIVTLLKINITELHEKKTHLICKVTQNC